MNAFNPRIPGGAREAGEILRFHQLQSSDFEGAVVYDLGCGSSDLQADLKELGVSTCVTGFDVNPDAREFREPTDESGKFVVCGLDDVQAPDASADIVIATYSLPMWGKSAAQITAFYEECQRLTRVGGLLSIYPIAVSIQMVDDSFEGEMERDNRVFAARFGASDILHSPLWSALDSDPEGLKARRIG